MAEGQLHLEGVCLLAPHLTPANADDLVAKATHQSKFEIKRLLAQRFPGGELPTVLQAVSGTPLSDCEFALAQVADAPRQAGAPPTQLAPAQVRVAEPRPRVAPLAPERFALQLTIGKSTHDKLWYAQALLSHAIPSGDIAQVLDRALDALIGSLEKRKFATTNKPRPRQCATVQKRYVPAHVRRAVWQRDRGQCTFVSQTGHRCQSRRFLELDHIDPVARGGQATVERMRLRCRAHNQYEAERTFGAGFMNEKRQQSRRAAAARAKAAAAARAEADAAARVQAVAQEQARDVMAGLRELGIRADKVRRAAELSQTLPEATLEDRMRAALKVLCPKTRLQSGVGTSVEASS